MSNTVKYYTLNCMYNTAIMLTSGTVLQVFLSNVGVGNEWIGIYASVVSMISIAVHLLFAKRADEIKNFKRANTRVLLLVGICCLGFLPPCLLWNAQALTTVVYFVVIPVGLLQTLFTSIYSVLGYKMPYYIHDVQYFGRIIAVNGSISYAGSTAVSLLLSVCTERFDYMQVMFCAFALSAVLVLLAAAVCRSYQMKEPTVVQTQNTGTIKAMIGLLRNRDFSILLLPNFLRGISMGIISVLAVVCLGLGHSNETASALVTVTYLAYFASSLLYFLGSKYISDGALCLIGAILLIPLGFAFGFGQRMFLILAFLTLFGKSFVDNAVPAKLYRIIPLEIACVYHAGRMLVTTAGMAVSSAVSGFLVEGDLTTLLLFMGIGAQLCSSLVYFLYRRKG